MTVYPDMHNAFRLHVDKSTSLVGSVDFLPEEIDFWLNEAQDRFIKERLSGNNYLQKKFDETQKRIDDIRTLIVVSAKQSLVQSSLGSNVKYTFLPDLSSGNPYLYYLSAVVYDTLNNTLQVGGQVKITEIGRYIKDTVNNPYMRRPLVHFYNEGSTAAIAIIYSDEFIPISCTITYIKKPKQLIYSIPGTYQTNTCELAEHTHREIVVLAASLAIENIESQRVKTFEQLNASKIE